MLCIRFYTLITLSQIWILLSRILTQRNVFDLSISLKTIVKDDKLEPNFKGAFEGALWKEACLYWVLVAGWTLPFCGSICAEHSFSTESCLFQLNWLLSCSSQMCTASLCAVRNLNPDSSGHWLSSAEAVWIVTWSYWSDIWLLDTCSHGVWCCWHVVRTLDSDSKEPKIDTFFPWPWHIFSIMVYIILLIMFVFISQFCS